MMAKQMIDANKTAFDNSFKAMVMLQEQAEKMTATVLEQMTWLPDEGKKMVREWIDACRKGRDDYKKMVDDGYKRIADFLGSAGQ
jgi:hypothetical protein